MDRGLLVETLFRPPKNGLMSDPCPLGLTEMLTVAQPLSFRLHVVRSMLIINLEDPNSPKQEILTYRYFGPRGGYCLHTWIPRAIHHQRTVLARAHSHKRPCKEDTSLQRNPMFVLRCVRPPGKERFLLDVYMYVDFCANTESTGACLE